MAELIIHSEKIKENIIYLSQYFENHNIEWSLITKVFSGDKTFLKHILTQDVIKKITSVGDSKLSNLKNLRAVYPDLKTIFINPTAQVNTDDVVMFADISLNTSISTIMLLNESAKKINIIHKVIIMIELGDLREGINNEDLIDFYKSVYNLPHIEVLGIGSNLGCLFGVEPTYEKLLQLSLNKNLISSNFNINLELLSGGTSITLPLLDSALVPNEINHFRIGEAAFLGICPSDEKQFKDLHINTFEFYANIIELVEKVVAPDQFSLNGINDYEKNSSSNKSYKAILDFGLLDVDIKDLRAIDTFSYVGATSDMLVIDVGKNESNYKVGDKIKFKLNYMAVARLLNSKFIDKVYI